MIFYINFFETDSFSAAEETFIEWLHSAIYITAKQGAVLNFTCLWLQVS